MTYGRRVPGRERMGHRPWWRRYHKMSCNKIERVDAVALTKVYKEKRKGKRAQVASSEYI